MTCYLGQSVPLQPLLAPWGLDLGAAPLWTLLPLAAAVQLVLALFATAWLRRFRFGRVEWVLPSWTYGTWQPLRHRHDAPVTS